LRDIYGEKISFLVSILWAIHPVNSEAITYISGTADPLFLFFGLFAIYLYNRNFKILSYISFIFSLLSKETGVLILPLFFLYQYCSNRLNKSEIKNYVIITLIFLIYFILRQTILNFGKAEPEDIFLHRFYTSFKAFLIYISILLFPFILSMERHIPYIKTFRDIDFIIGFIYFLIFLYFLLKNRNDRKILFAGTLFLINFIFHSNTIIPLNGNLREHWMYVGAVGFFVYFLKLFDFIKEERKRIILIIIIFSLYGVRTILRNYDWKEPVKFYEKNLKYFPESKEILHNYSFTLLLNKDYQKALENFKKLYSISIKQEDKKVIFGIGKCYLMLGNYDEALKYYYKGIKIDPSNLSALLDIAIIYEKKGKIEKAKEILNYLIEKEYQPAFVFLGNIYFKNGNYDISEKFFLKAIELNREDNISLKFLSKIYIMKRDFNKAVYYLEKVSKLEPENLDCLNDLAISLNEIGKKEKAIKILKDILKKNPNYKPAKQNLQIILSK